MFKAVSSSSAKIFDYLFLKFLSEKTKNKVEVIILMTAIASFIIHLGLIFLVDFGFLQISETAGLFKNPITAIYTPFSFILIYEVYLLIYYLPKSITVYIGKQYEIMTLILIRRLFKDLSHLQLTSDWFSVKGDIAFTFDLLATVILFVLILVFYSLNPQKDEKTKIVPELSKATTLFIRMKNWIATLLVPILVVIASYSLFDWLNRNFFNSSPITSGAPQLDGIFFDHFFTILILADVLLLLISFLRTDRFSTVIRNSGFVISTILIKVSFGTEPILNSVLVVVAVLFGVIILAIEKRYDRLGLKS